MTLPPYAIAVILDNSDTAIDGDFYPNRFGAQKTTVDRLAQYYFSTNPESQIAIHTMGSAEFGIRCSFTSMQSKIISAMNNVSTGGKLLFQKALKCALMSLKHCSDKVEEKRVLAFIGNDHDVTSREIANSISSTFRREDVPLDIVIIGKNVPNVSFFRRICSDIPRSTCLNVPSCDTVLSDVVLKSDIRPGKKISQINPREIGCNDPKYLTALFLSQQVAKQKKKEATPGSIDMLINQEAPTSTIGRTAQVHKPKRSTKKK